MRLINIPYCKLVLYGVKIGVKKLIHLKYHFLFHLLHKSVGKRDDYGIIALRPSVKGQFAVIFLQ